MGKIKSPNAGENVLKWAKDITKEVNSLNPTAGPGQKITKTDAGTTYSLNPKDIPFPDATPKIAPATYSIEKNNQNAFSFFGFSDLSGVQPTYRLSSDVDFVIRDRGSDDAINHLPTVRYVSVSALLSNMLNPGGDGGDGDDGNPFGITPDSEINIPGVNPATYSIQHNSQDALALYHFEGTSASDKLDELDENKDLLLVRHVENGGSPVLKYTDKFGQISADSEVTSPVTTSIEHNSQDAMSLYHFENLSSGDILENPSATDYVLVRHPGTGGAVLKYASLSAGGSGDVTVDSEADTVVSKSVEHNADGDLALYDFTTTGADISPSERDYGASGNKYGLFLLCRWWDVDNPPKLVYRRLSLSADVDTGENPVRSRSIENSKSYNWSTAPYLRLYRFFDANSTEAESNTRDDSDILVRSTDGGGGLPPTLRYYRPVRLLHTLGGKNTGNSTTVIGDRAFYDVTLTGRTLTFKAVQITVGDGGLVRNIWRPGGSQDISITIPTTTPSGADGASGSPEFVSSVSYDTSTHKLTYTTKHMNFNAGLYTGTTAGSTYEITTAVPEQLPNS